MRKRTHIPVWPFFLTVGFAAWFLIVWQSGEETSVPRAEHPILKDVQLIEIIEKVVEKLEQSPQAELRRQKAKQEAEQLVAIYTDPKIYPNLTSDDRSKIRKYIFRAMKVEPAP